MARMLPQTPLLEIGDAEKSELAAGAYGDCLEHAVRRERAGSHISRGRMRAQAAATEPA